MTNGTEEWGPWIEHDGKSCPVRNGEYVQVVCRDILCRYDLPIVLEGVAHGNTNCMSGWLWENADRVRVFLRYRIRKPRALRQLQGIAANAPAQEEQEA